MSALPSASKTHLAFTCLGSVVLPGVDSLNEHADKGNAKHAFLALCLKVGRDAALAEVPEEFRADCAALDVSELPASQPGQWLPEVAMAFDVTTGAARVLGSNIGRDYRAAGRTERDIAGSADVVGLTDDAVVVYDYKTGKQPVTRCRDNWQMRTLAVMAARAFERPKAIAAVLYVDDDGAARYDFARWDAFDLDGFAVELQHLGALVLDPSAALPPLRVGTHCRYCPALTTCPAQGAFVRQLVATPKETLAELEAGLQDDDTARAVYERIEAVEAVVKKAKTALYERAMARPIPLGNGEVFGLTESERESLVGPVVRRVVTELHGAAVGDAAVELEATKAGVKRALESVAKATGKKLGTLERETLEAIRKAGGAETKVTRTVKPHRALLPSGT